MPSIPSGLAAQIGFAAESTYGTRVVPTRFLEFENESLKLNVEDIEAGGLRAGSRVQRQDRQIANKLGAGGEIELEHHNKGFGLMWKHALGAVAITTPMGGTLSRKHSHTIADPTGLFLTCQVGRPDTGGTVRPFDYVGCKVEGWELTQELDKILMLKLGLDAKDEKTDQSLASASYVSSTELFHHGQLVVQVAASGLDVMKFGLKYDPGLHTDRRLMGSAGTPKKEPLPAKRIGLEGELQGEFESLTAYNRFVNRTIVAVQATWLGSLIEGVIFYKIDITLPAVRFKGTTPNVGGEDILEQPLPFEVLDDGTNPPITVDLYTTDTVS